MTANSSNWILWLLGKDAETIPENAELRLTWTNLPQSWQVFLLIGVALGMLYVVGLLYSRESDACSRKVKTVLAGLRIAVILALLAVFLGPAITYSRKRTIPARITLLPGAPQPVNTAAA